MRTARGGRSIETAGNYSKMKVDYKLKTCTQKKCEKGKLKIWNSISTRNLRKKIKELQTTKSEINKK